MRPKSFEPDSLLGINRIRPQVIGKTRSNLDNPIFQISFIDLINRQSRFDGSRLSRVYVLKTETIGSLGLTLPQNGKRSLLGEAGGHCTLFTAK